MKTIQLAVTLLIVCIGCAEALRCNQCLITRRSCTPTVQQCGWGEDVCVSVNMGSPSYFYFKRCATRNDAKYMEANPYLIAQICETDLCN